MPKAAAGAFALTSLSDRKSKQPTLTHREDSNNPSVSKDQMPMLGGGNLMIENPQATDSTEIQPGEVQSPILGDNSSTSKEVGAECSSEEIGRADGEMSDDPEEQVV